MPLSLRMREQCRGLPKQNNETRRLRKELKTDNEIPKERLGFIKNRPASNTKAHATRQPTGGGNSKNDTAIAFNETEGKLRPLEELQINNASTKSIFVGLPPLARMVH